MFSRNLNGPRLIGVRGEDAVLVKGESFGRSGVSVPSIRTEDLELVCIFFKSRSGVTGFLAESP